MFGQLGLETLQYVLMKQIFMLIPDKNLKSQKNPPCPPWKGEDLIN
jgi:hypothetical protein